MFRVIFHVEDKKLGDALQALTGIAITMPQATPVAADRADNAVAIDGHLKDFAALLQPFKGKVVRAKEIRPMIKKMGYRPTARGILIRQAVSANLLRKSGTGAGSFYTVL